ncbi:MAG TPA: glycosyltransferase family 4 protein [Acidimicrobiales bacterium]|nr:glycosyltransferase family 4 protein [Acidimicrobiales bacterium]
MFDPGSAALDPHFDPVGGMQFHTSQLTAALDARGVAQTVVTAWRPGAPRSEHLGASAHVYRFGGPVRRARQGYALLAAASADRLGRGADIVHAHLGEDLAVSGLAALAARHGAPLVLTVHCSARHTLTPVDARAALLRLLGRPVERWAEQRAASLIVLTPRAATDIAGDGMSPDRVRVIPSGVDHRLFTGPFPDPMPAVGRPRVLFVGRLSAQKGVDGLLRAMTLLRSGAPLVVVGDGPKRGELERLATRVGLRSRTWFTGFVPHARVPAYLHHADVLVLPSRYEELGSVLIEALAAGTPVVATAVGGIPSAALDGETGLLVPPGDVTSLAAAIDRVLDDPVLATRLGATGRRRAAEYSWPRLAAEVHDAYLDVLGTGRWSDGGDRRRSMW